MEKSQQQAETLAQRLKKTVATQQNIILDAFRELSTLGSRIRSDTGITTGIVPDASPASSSSTPEVLTLWALRDFAIARAIARGIASC